MGNLPQRTRYKKVMKFVYDFFYKEDIDFFPIKPLEIIRKNKWGLISYSELAKEHNKSIEEIVDAFQSEDGYTIYNENYIIAYNDTVKVPNRIRFTLMHEIGHVYLNHLIDFDETILRRSTLTMEDYKILEREANAFARNVLAPAAIVNEIKKESRNNITTGNLISYFQITKAAAETRFKILDWDIDKSYNFSEPIIHKFKNFISATLYGKSCTNCGNYFSIKNSKFCPVCSNNKLIKKIRRSKKVKYKAIKIDDNYRTIECPICKNENIVGDYCQICGTYLINKCTGFSINDEGIYNGPWHEQFRDSCGEYLNGDARFCVNCGSTSTFYESGLLKKWEDSQDDAELKENNDKRNLKVVNGTDPFADPLETTDDDLPF